MECLKLNSTQVDENIRQIATSSYDYSLKVRQCLITDTTPWWSIWRVVQKIEDILAAWREGVEIERIFFTLYSPRCGYTSWTFLIQNMFHQKHVVQFAQWSHFVDALKDPEPGVFTIGSQFLDHCFVVVKFFEKDVVNYRVVQSYVNEYSLEKFINTHGEDFKYSDFNKLNTEFISPLADILLKKELPERTRSELFKKLTKVNTNRFSNIAFPAKGADIKLLATATTRKGIPWGGTRHFSWKELVVHLFGSTIAGGLFTSILLSLSKRMTSLWNTQH